jgi:divalent metal cation (Fe/Co/Zn/Cd) transporter
MIFNLNLDGYIGLVIASFIIKSSIEMIRDPINDIIGKRINDDFKIKIIKEIQSYDDVKGVFDLIVHNYGPVTIIGSVHIEIDDNMTAKEIHKLCKEIEYQLYKKYDIIMTIGIYASNDSSEDAKKIRREINKIIKEFDNIIQVHGFYIDEKEKRVIFDLIYNYKEKNIDKTNNIIKEKLKEKYSDYKYYINIDKDFG